MPDDPQRNEHALLLPNAAPISPNLLTQTSLTVFVDDATYWQLLKKLWEQSWPLVLRGIVVSGRYFANAYFLGRVDHHLLAPNTMVNAIESLLVVFGGRSLSPVSSYIAKLNGENNNEKIGLIFRHGLLIAFLISLPITALYYFANHHFVHLLGQHHFVVDNVRKYFQAAALGYMPLTLLTAEQRLLQGLHKPFFVLLSNVMHSGLSVLFSWLFLYDKFGLDKKMDMDGLGYAFVAAGWLTLFLNTICLAVAQSLKPYTLMSTKGGIDRKELRYLVQKGLPTGLQYTTENIGLLINSMVIGWYSLTALAADQIAAQLALAISIANAGLSQGVSVCVAKALGQDQYRALVRFGNLGIALGALLPVLTGLFLLFFRKNYVSVFVDVHDPKNQELVGLSEQFALMECLRQLMCGLQFMASGALLGLMDTSFPMKTSVGFSLMLNAAVLALFYYALHLKELAIYGAKAIGMGISGLCNVERWVLKSHEVSEADQQAVSGKSLRQRMLRSGQLLFGCLGPETITTPAPAMGSLNV